MSRLLAFLLLSVLLAGCSEGQKPEPAKRPLYERLGGEKAIARVVDDFVAIVVADPKIGKRYKEHFGFEKGDVTALKKELVERFAQATGGPQKYTGKNLKDAHAGKGIGNADHDALVASLKKALDENKVPKTEQDELLSLLWTFRKDAVEK